MCHERSSQNLCAAHGHECMAWSDSDDTPGMIFMRPTYGYIAPRGDSKVPMLEDCPPPVFEEPPPKYDSAHVCHRGSSSSCFKARLSERLPVKFLVMAVYLIFLYRISTASFEPNMTNISWTWAQAPMRVHSRDFGSLSAYEAELVEEADGWSRSRLGRLGAFSPLLTSSEAELFFEAGWEPDPSADPATTDDQEELEEQETIFTDLPNVPLPFHHPSALFKYSRNPYDQGFRHSSYASESVYPSEPAYSSESVYPSEPTYSSESGYPSESAYPSESDFQQVYASSPYSRHH